jgi:hypothetical protein
MHRDLWRVCVVHDLMTSRYSVIRNLRTVGAVGVLAALTACSGSSVAASSTHLPYSTIVGENQRILLVPDMEVGGAGWCVAEIGGGYECSAAFITVPIVTQSWSMSAPPQRVEGYAVTTWQVAAVSVDGGPRIPTRQEPGLPYGLRVAAVKLTGFDDHGSSSRQRLPRFTPLSKDGRPIRKQVTRRRLAGLGLAVHTSDDLDTGTGVCNLEETAPRGGLRLKGASVVQAVEPRHELLKGALLPCANATFELQGATLRATVLIDAAKPGSTPGSLPASRPVAGHPGIVEAPGPEGAMLARRVPRAWLVIDRGDNSRQRLALLQHVGATVSVR